MSYTDFSSEPIFAPDQPFANVGGEVDYELMNKGITPIFFIEPVLDQKASDEAGCPRYRNAEHVRLMVAGDSLNVPVLPVDDGIKQRFAPQYARWKTNRDDKQIDGTPLKEWPLLTPAQIMEFRGINVFTVEQLSEISDANVTRLYDGRVWRKKATDWLRIAKDSGVVNQQAVQIERQNEKIAELEKTLLEMSAHFAAHSEDAADAPRRGRPPKAA